MAQCKLSPQEFVRDAFVPQIAVTCSVAAQECSKKNNLDFRELLQPFSKLTDEVTYKDPSGSITTVKNLKFSFLDIKSGPPQTTLARKILNLSVSEASEPRTKTFQVKNYQIEIPASTPWYENWRDTFLSVQYPSDHEFTKHFLACFVVVSSNETNPLEAITQLESHLNQIQNNTNPDHYSKWFSSNILKYYIILHDNMEGNISFANESFEALKTLYGPTNCFLLQMNSRPPGLNSQDHIADQWSQFTNRILTSDNYQIAPESSPDQKRPFPATLEEAESKGLNYHPLSPDVEEIANNLMTEQNQLALNPSLKWSHGSCLSVDDVEQIKSMLYEFTKTCLLPNIEKQLILLNDSIGNKKGVSKSLFSATKRWFSGNKPNASHLTVNNLIYSIDSPELQIRKLGDLYFMFGNYTAAFQAYHAAKRDYNMDQAWLYYAGALEMAALAAFMANESCRKTYDYMEESITTYLTTCKMAQFATRATILSLECLKSKHLYGETAHQLIRMTSEDSDLRSALLLEQASYCFLESNMLRKYAFHMVLSGHRYSKAAQKKHSLRCYKQAYQIYEKSGWDLATDHIHYTIGRLANNLEYFQEAVESFARLMTGQSKQSATQQSTFLKEYLAILEMKLKVAQSVDTPSLPIPELDNSSVKVLVEPTRPLSTPGKNPAMGISFKSSEDVITEHRWLKLEEILLSEETGSVPLIFKPMKTLYTISAMENSTPLAIINEPIQVAMQLINPLQTVLLLKDIYLLWIYQSENETVTNLKLNDNVDKFIKTFVIKSLLIQGNSKQELILSLTPLVTGNVTISAVCYTLSGSNSTADTLFVKGKKLINISSDTQIIKPIEVKVVPYAPCLQMAFSEMNLDFLAGEVHRVSVDLRNTGSVPLRNVMIATSVPHLLSNCEIKTDNFGYTIDDGETQQVKEKLARKNHITSVSLPEDRLETGQTIAFHVWVRAPDTKGPSSIDLLTYYENVASKSVPKYRLIRHVWNLSVQESLSVDVCTQTSYNSSISEDLNLAVKATNLNKIHNTISTEVMLLNVALLSNNWVLTKEIITPKYITLISQESVHIFCKARRKVSKHSQYSSIALSSDKATLSHLQTAYKVFAKKSHNPPLNVFDLDLEEKKRDATLILEWRALVCDALNKRIVYGHTCVPVKVNSQGQQLDKLIADSVADLNTSQSIQDKVANFAQNQVIYNLLYPSVVRHNFVGFKNCVIPITLVLHSVVENAVAVTINTIDPRVNYNVTKTFKSNVFTAQATKNFCWLTNGKITRLLPPLATTSVNLFVMVANPGTFDLGANLGVLCTKTGSEQIPVLQFHGVASSLIVLQSDVGLK